MDIFAFGNSIYKGLKEYVEKELLSTYPKLRINTSVIEPQYPLIIFAQEGQTFLGESTRNEIIEKSYEFEINVYAKNELVNGVIVSDEKVLSDLVNAVMYYLQNICRFKRINLQTNLMAFDNKKVQSKRAVIRWNVKGLQKYNTIL